jgi:DNA-binding NarL/FixJ family response regulator
MLTTLSPSIASEGQRQRTFRVGEDKALSESDSPLRVFLVEDSPILRERLIESLAVPGVIDVSGHADTESAALAWLASEPWDALVLDLQLKQGSGLGVLRALQHRRPPHTCLIVLTNYAIPQYRSKSLQLGADYFFDKSREYSQVKDVLLSHARRRTSRSR